ncbi:PXDNL [Symbiodinium sp. CCMP2592]|nr:PXDNL [Symbiodinium sp. CCMP2592]
MKLGRNHAVTITILATACALPVAIAQMQPSKSTKSADKGAQQQDRRSSLNQRKAQPIGEVEGQGVPSGPAVFPLEFRTIDGTFNNSANPTWGAAGTNLVRSVAADYADGLNTPAGAGRPSARKVSNDICAQGAVAMPNNYNYSDFVWQWGQFLDHDIDETPIASPAEHFDVIVPSGDAWFDPGATGTVTIAVDRSAYTHDNSGVRQQINNISSWIDGTNVYGSDTARETELRTNDGTGKLKTSAGNLLPFNTNGFHNAPTEHDPTLFLAGDVRANEQVGLTAMHTLFVREHNRLADQIAIDNPGFTGEQIYQHAKAIVTAQLQAITYNEFLPKLLGPGSIPPFAGYNDSIDPGITNLFATAAYRVGHTMLSTQIMRTDEFRNEITAGHLSLANAFFSPDEVINHGIDPLLRGLASQHAQTVDIFVVDDVRNFLFGAPGSGGFDLASLNLQRGRDHGLPSYNDIRVAFGRPAVVNFSDINPDANVIAGLSASYADVDQIDAWVGLLAEPHRPGAFVGETLFRVLSEQFTKLRDADRFWYQTYLPPHMVTEVENTKLSHIIRRNTGIGPELQEDVFSVEAVCVADFAAPAGALNFLDVSEFLTLYGLEDPAADINEDGNFNFLDIAKFLDFFAAGCP